MGRKQRKAGVALLLLFGVCIVACIVFFASTDPPAAVGAAEAAEAAEAVAAVAAVEAVVGPAPAGTSPVAADSLFGRSGPLSKACAGDTRCELGAVDGGIDMSATTCDILHMEKFASGVAVYTDATKKTRLVPVVGSDKLARIGVETNAHKVSSDFGPYFIFIPGGHKNVFFVHVAEKFVVFETSGASVLGEQGSALTLEARKDLPNRIVLKDAALDSETTAPRLLRRALGRKLSLYVAEPVSYVTNVCASAGDDANTLYGLNGTQLEYAANASKSMALMTCNFVGEWASKPSACEGLCARAYPHGDADWCKWSTRVDLRVASNAANAGPCCVTLGDVDQAVSAIGGKQDCGEVREQLWVGVPYTNGAFGEAGPGMRLVKVPAYATIAMRLSRVGMFSSACE
jgi:hypothetical protein